jgi:exodeoxyribonuclease V beta subunit
MTSSPLYQPLGDRVLIEAGAGTGKTYTLAGLFVRLLLERDLHVENILVVTFTKAATEELKSRIRLNIAATLKAIQGEGKGEEFHAWLAARQDPATAIPRLRRAMADFDLSAIFTIHGFCQRILTEHAFLSRSPFDPMIVAGDEDLVSEVARDFWRRETYTASPLFAHYLLEKGASPQSLTRTVHAGLNHPNLRVVPSHRLPTPRCSRSASSRRWTRHAQCWPLERDRVNDFLCGSPDLNRAKYRQAAMPGLVAALDRPDLRPAARAPLRRLRTPDHECDTRGAQEGLLRHPCDFFGICDEIHESASLLEQAFARRLAGMAARLFETLRSEIAERKAAVNRLGFGDLLERASAALSGPGGGALAGKLRERLHAALIDEFQDTDPLQYAIFQAVFGTARTPLYLIGDPKQAIYSFRGADVHAYIRAARTCPERHTLATNYRSVAGLLEAVNLLFGNRSNPFSVDGIGYLPALSPSPTPSPAKTGRHRTVQHCASSSCSRPPATSATPEQGGRHRLVLEGRGRRDPLPHGARGKGRRHRRPGQDQRRSRDDARAPCLPRHPLRAPCGGQRVPLPRGPGARPCPRGRCRARERGIGEGGAVHGHPASGLGFVRAARRRPVRPDLVSGTAARVPPALG